MPEKKLNDLFYDTLKDIYFAERQILKACRRWPRRPSRRNSKTPS